MIDFDFHPDVEAALEQLRDSLVDANGNHRFETVDDMIRQHVWDTLSKVALDRFPAPDFAAAVEAKKVELDNFIAAEFECRRTCPAEIRELRKTQPPEPAPEPVASVEIPANPGVPASPGLMDRIKNLFA